MHDIFLSFFLSFWDDWIREPAQRRNRACIRPELSRTKTFGKKGVSKLVFHFFFQINFLINLFFLIKQNSGLFFEKHLKFIKLNTEFVPFTKMNLSYLLKVIFKLKYNLS